MMPWRAEDAERHTAKANTPKKQALWASVANRVLEKTGDEGQAIRQANAAVGQLHHVHRWT